METPSTTTSPSTEPNQEPPAPSPSRSTFVEAFHDTLELLEYIFRVATKDGRDTVTTACCESVCTLWSDLTRGRDLLKLRDRVPYVTRHRTRIIARRNDTAKPICTLAVRWGYLALAVKLHDEYGHRVDKTTWIEVAKSDWCGGVAWLSNLLVPMKDRQAVAEAAATAGSLHTMMEILHRSGLPSSKPVDIVLVAGEAALAGRVDVIRELYIHFSDIFEDEERMMHIATQALRGEDLDTMYELLLIAGSIDAKEDKRIRSDMMNTEVGRAEMHRQVAELLRVHAKSGAFIVDIEKGRFCERRRSHWIMMIPPGSMNQAIYAAANVCDIDTMGWFLQQYAGYRHTFYEHSNPYSGACEIGDTETLIWLCTNLNIPRDMHNTYIKQVVDECAERGDRAMLKFFCDYWPGADIWVKVHAIGYGLADVLDWLDTVFVDRRSRGSKVDDVLAIEIGVAVRRGYLHIAQRLYKQIPSSVRLDTDSHQEDNDDNNKKEKKTLCLATADVLKMVPYAVSNNDVEALEWLHQLFPRRKATDVALARLVLAETAEKTGCRAVRDWATTLHAHANPLRRRQQERATDKSE